MLKFVIQIADWDYFWHHSTGFIFYMQLQTSEIESPEENRDQSQEVHATYRKLMKGLPEMVPEVMFLY